MDSLKVERYEEFIENKLKVDLRKQLSKREELFKELGQ